VATKKAAKKTVGKRKPAAPAIAASGEKPSRRAARPPQPPRRKVELTDGDKQLVQRLSDKTGLVPREIIERALAGYAAAVAPGMPLEPPPKPKGRSVTPTQSLFLSVDGKPEVEVKQSEFVLGSGAEGVDLRLDLPLISPRHARILWRDNSFIFEDLKSARGSYRHGHPRPATRSTSAGFCPSGSASSRGRRDAFVTFSRLAVPTAGGP
jgi:hypothetical protein